MENFKTRFIELQNELKAPKSQRNNFGNYNYRSAEDILEAVKPLNKKYSVLLNLSDEIVAVGSRIYVKATATLTDIESDEAISVTAFAREAETKKGMDDSQITGTASSYARKYALNGLYCIDDTKDADTDAYREQQEALATPQEKKMLMQMAEAKGIAIDYILKQVGAKKGGKMTREQYGNALRIVNEASNED